MVAVKGGAIDRDRGLEAGRWLKGSTATALDRGIGHKLGVGHNRVHLGEQAATAQRLVVAQVRAGDGDRPGSDIVNQIDCPHRNASAG